MSNFVNTSVTINRDGYAYCHMTNASYCRIGISNENWMSQSWDYGDRTRRADVCIPVRRGQTVTINSNTDNPGNSRLYLILAQHEVI